jgi:ADP-heptose:LPS heptosyltransferase
MAERTLAVSLQGLGNAFLTLPLAKALAAAGDAVTLLTLSPRGLPALARAPFLDDALAAGDPAWRGAAGRWRLLRELRCRRFDRAVFSFPSGANAYRFVRLTGIPARYGHAYPEVGRAAGHLTHAVVPLRQGHDLDQNLQLAAALGLPHNAADLWPILTIPPDAIDRAQAWLTKKCWDPHARYLGLHTGCDGQWAEKRWPAEHFAALAEKIYAQYGLPALVLDGPAEAGSGRQVARLAKSPVLAMDGYGDLADAWGLMALCDLFVANDSGLMNLAAASGVPTVAVFGPSQVWRTRPYGPRGRAVVAGRTCVPCFGLGPYAGCPFPYHHCLTYVSVDRVAAAAGELLAR